MKRATSFDVAQKAGVSRSVVSAVLNNTRGIGVSEEKRRAVLQAIEELNYVVDVQAKGMRTGRSQCIAAYGNLKNPFFAQMLQGLQKVCNERGYYVLLCGASADAGVDPRKKLLDLFLQRRIDGIVSKDTTGYMNEEWEREVHRLNIPHVSVEGFPESDGIASVQMDYGQSVREALDYAWSRTKLPPVYLELFNGPVHAPNWGDRHRTQAYLAWMREHGLEPNVLQKLYQAWPEDEAWWFDLVHSWKGRQVSVLTNWSRASVAIYRAAYEVGLRIGSDVHVMAADNTEQLNEAMVPALSAVEVPYAEMGEAAALRLLEYTEGTRALADTERIWLPAKLMARESM
ncbi:LacI family DNA-binding transcriptional regulator [Paenibacillus cremeus]|uniref:LacI family transcriptional regulator n=1 Tax=Paenibacillus cremeus TaxID=2163881 RepID=A0A559K6D3_9BACL|nr:LacI family DNA-binding transcriptional regulator [Paenibacillus cremeus]TVY07657.1 LacI family transcriptional regulator [Paenibacillus cremeus]